ncbi:MAG TPA: hypothetical protein VFE71_04910 [Bacteroidales bacterium]|nr:hypothetical protein [Bacteroidales bacterium]
MFRIKYSLLNFTDLSLSPGGVAGGTEITINDLPAIVQLIR